MSLSTFLDVAWAELWDDVSPMGDRSRWHQIVTELFVEGKDPYDITWKDSDGKYQRLSDQPRSADAPPPKQSIDQAREWQEKLKARRIDLVQSSDDGR